MNNNLIEKPGNNRIKLTDTTLSAVIKMSEGNPGAIHVLMELLTDSNYAPEISLNGLGIVMLLDSYGIYGTDIYILHNDICNRELPKTIAVIKACQLGFFSSDTLREACSRQDHSGAELVPVDELYDKVTKESAN